jgi:Condensation domain
MTSSYPDLSKTKSDLLKHYVCGGCCTHNAAATLIDPKASTSPTPIALIQEPLWFRAQTRGLPPLYNESITIHRSGSLDVVALREALSEIVRRHEAWRTTFRMIAGQPCQLIQAAPVTFPLSVIDLRQTRDAHAEWIRLATEEVSRPFDLEGGPLVRATLATLSDREHDLLIAAHQMVVDGVSAYDVFPTELTTCYEALVANKPSPLPSRAAQYSDFCTWHRNRMNGRAVDNEVRYWREHLANMPPPLPWPVDRPGPPVQTYRGVICPFSMRKSLVDKLNVLRKMTGVSLFAVLVAGFAALLKLYTGRDDIVLGTPASTGRDRSDFQALLGYFLNPVAMRLKLQDCSSFVDLLLLSQQSVCGALSHSNLPLEYIADKLGLKPDRSRHCAFQIAISLAPPLPTLCNGWSMTPMDFPSGGARWDLYLVFSEGLAGMLGRAQYNPDVVEPDTIFALVRDLKAVLQAVATNPYSRVSELSHMGMPTPITKV